MAASALGGEWHDLVVILAANNYDSVKVADQHLAEHMAEVVPVLYVDPPMSRLTVKRHPELERSLTGPRLRVLGPRLARLTPVVQPFPGRRGMTGLTTALTQRLVGRAVERLAGSVRAILNAWPMYNIGRIGPGCALVYWAQDDFVGGAQLLGLDAAHVARAGAVVARSADRLVAANHLVAETWRRRGFDPVLIPFGVDAAAYAGIASLAPPPDVDLPSPIAGCIGQINERTDLGLLEAIAGRGRSLLLVGPKRAGFEPTRFDALVSRPNVGWVGPKTFSELGAYMQMIDVGLVPYADSAFNRGSFPLKTLEYLAAGRPVVASDLPATRWLATDLIAIRSDPIAFADAVDVLLAAGRTAAQEAARRRYAADHDWSRRVAQMLETIDAVAGTSRMTSVAV